MSKLKTEKIHNLAIAEIKQKTLFLKCIGFKIEICDLICTKRRFIKRKSIACRAL